LATMASPCSRQSHMTPAPSSRVINASTALGGSPHRHVFPAIATTPKEKTVTPATLPGRIPSTRAMALASAATYWR
jgi:hypothetical protein